MVTFRKDIHLGRVVPFRPKDEGECMFVSITAEGVATDKFGRKWQLLPYEERAQAPKIVTRDVTTDAEYGYATEEYPMIAGKTDAVRLVEILERESDCNLYYKIIKDGIEPSLWTRYEESFTIKIAGRYRIKAKAEKTGIGESVETICDQFDIIRQRLNVIYGTLSVTAYTYGTIPAAGITDKLPNVSYGIPVSEIYTDDPTTPIPVGAETSGGTLVFSRIQAPNYITSLDSETGAITVSANGTTSSRVAGSLRVTVTLRDQTAELTTNVQQEGIAATDNVIIWDTDPSSGSHTIGDTVSFAAHTEDGAVIVFKDGNNNTISGTTESGGVYSNSVTLASGSTTIKAVAAETTTHNSTTSIKTVSASAPVIPMYWGMSINNEYTPTQASPYSSGTTLISDLDSGGTFTSGASKGDGSSLYASIYFAVPQGKTVSIEGANAGGVVTTDFTKITIGGYDIYYQIGYLQELFTITVS
jgi:hypothetical protein